jgi:hypothetical protein
VTVHRQLREQPHAMRSTFKSVTPTSIRACTVTRAALLLRLEARSVCGDIRVGCVFVGVEANGIYAHALTHSSGGFQRVAAIASGQAGTMGLEFDRDRNARWAHCDDTCGNRSTLLAVDGVAGSSTLG